MTVKGIGRRDFMKAMGLLSIAPFSSDILRWEPYWLRVLSRGVEYFQYDKSSLGDLVDQPEKLRDIAYRKVRDEARQMYAGIYSDLLEYTDRNMDTLVDDYKSAQFLLEQIPGNYTYCDGFPPVTSCSDPVRSYILRDLSTMILGELDVRLEVPFIVDSFNRKLASSSLGYAQESVATIRRAIGIAPEFFIDTLNTHLAKGLVIAGDASLYLGYSSMAEGYYRKAIEVIPPGTDKKSIFEDRYDDVTEVILPQFLNKAGHQAP